MGEKTRLSPEEAKRATEALEILFASEHVNKRRLYWANFVRGFFFSLGTVMGATIMLSLLLSILSYTENVPFVNSISRNIKHTIEQSKN